MISGAAVISAAVVVTAVLSPYKPQCAIVTAVISTAISRQGILLAFILTPLFNFCIPESDAIYLCIIGPPVNKGVIRLAEENISITI